jgi:hypothetical protein
VATLERPRLAARLTEIASKPIELFNRALPEAASKAIAVTTTQALNSALRMALRTLNDEPKAASSYLHKTLASTSGAIGGSFGLAALLIELPISTIIILRSIGDIARAEGEDLRDPETMLSCLQVFALACLRAKLTPRIAGILRCAACCPNRSPKPRASLSIAGCWRKAAQFWCAYWHRSHPVSVSLSLRSLRLKLCQLSERSAAQR